MLVNPGLSIAPIGEDKAIVTDIAGTTRDTIEEYISIKDCPPHIIDAAAFHAYGMK